MKTRLKMNFLVSLILIFGSVNVLASRMGDDAGNGGFAFKQSIKILKMAAAEVVEKVRNSDFPELMENPVRREILVRSLQYSNLILRPNEDAYRGGRLLAMDYVVNPPMVKVYKAFYMSFAGTLDEHLEAASREVQKRLLHEASHIWGYDEERAEKFSLDFLEYDGDIFDDVPDRANISITSGHCICRDGVSIGQSSCKNFCQARSSTSKTLFGNATLQPTDLTSGYINNLHEWCNKELPNSSHVSPQCFLEVYNGDETVTLPIVTNRSNSFTVNLDPLKFNRPYVLKIVSSTGAMSTAFQIRMNPSITPIDPLMVESLNQYYCVFSSGVLDDGGFNYRNSINQNYSYSDRLLPQPIPNHAEGIFCHDRVIYGGVDSILFPRLGLIENSGSVWSLENSRFADLDNDGKEDINTEIESTLLEEFDLDVSLDLFLDFNGAIDPFSTSITKGKLLTTFIDPLTGRNFCPTRERYSYPEPLFQVLGRYLAVDTEPMYMARREAVVFEDGTIAPEDYLFLSKSVLSPIWFYVKNGMILAPNEDDRFRKTLFFYWPADHNDPFVKKSYQKIYRISAVEDQEIRTPDKSFACAPKISDFGSDPRGNVGESCKSDTSCLSGCCNESTGTCSTHEPALGQLCQKSPGQSCISDEFCRVESVPVCKVMRTGYDQSGNVTCALRCFNEQRHGSCQNNRCLPVDIPPVPPFDSSNPDCSNAQ